MNSVARFTIGPGYALAQACAACGHTRCGPACPCDCASVRAQAEALPPDPRADLWSGFVGEVLVIIGTYHGVLDVQARVRGSQRWAPADERLEAEASIKALAEKPQIEEALRAGVWARHQARTGVRQ